jgi:hypothetical protein
MHRAIQAAFGKRSEGRGAGHECALVVRDFRSGRGRGDIISLGLTALCVEKFTTVR